MAHLLGHTYWFMKSWPSYPPRPKWRRSPTEQASVLLRDAGQTCNDPQPRRRDSAAGRSPITWALQEKSLFSQAGDSIEAGFMTAGDMGSGPFRVLQHQPLTTSCADGLLASSRLSIRVYSFPQKILGSGLLKMAPTPVTLSRQLWRVWCD